MSDNELPRDVQDKLLWIARGNRPTLAALAAGYRLGLKEGHGELAGKHAEWCSRVCPCEAAIREAKGNK